MELALASWRVFTNFAAYLGDPEASAGLVRCGYLIASPDGEKLEPLRFALAAQQARGIEVRLLDAGEASSWNPMHSNDSARENC